MINGYIPPYMDEAGKWTNYTISDAVLPNGNTQILLYLF